MVVKKYLVRDMPEAMAGIRRDLGPEAVIISSYRVPAPGWRGLFLKRLEVTAALDERREESGRLGGEGQVRRRETRGRPLFSGRRSDQPERLPQPAGWNGRLAALQLHPDLARLVTEDGVSASAGEDLARYRLEQRVAGWCERFCAPGVSSRVVVLTGPAGAGKTTSLVKLAGQDVLYGERKVAIVSVTPAGGGYAVSRPGSTEILRYWARLLGVPFASVSQPGELDRLQAAWSGIERFYLDTAPDPFFKTGRLLELAGFLEGLSEAQVLLVLSATTRDADVLRTVAEAGRLGCDGVVLTRLDEASCLGPVVSLLPRLNLPLRYVGDGPEVPDDLHPAGGVWLAGKLLGGADRDAKGARGLLAAQ